MSWVEGEGDSTAQVSTPWICPVTETDAMTTLSLDDAANRKLVSVASCWEIAIKVGNRKLTLDVPAAVFVPRELARNDFDRLLIVQAQSQGGHRQRGRGLRPLRCHAPLVRQPGAP